MLTTILIALLLVAVPYTVLATDSDGDGTDDADDDFPNNPCADTDTDGDGLPDTVVSGCSSQSVVGYTSFEDPFTIASVKYTDTGSESVSRYLWNNANEPHIAHNQTNGSEMGFTLYYTSTGGVGLTDGDYFGTINYTGTVGNFTDGNNGYQMSDVDGIATLALDDITAEVMTFDFFLQDTGYETSNPVDYLVIRFIGANSDIEIVNTTGYDIDTDNSSWIDTWTTMTVMIGAAGHGHLEVEFASNSAEETLYLDNIQFTSTVVLTADSDDDGDGWLDTDEVDCGTDPLDGNDVPADADSNGICDALEGDDFDGDGIPNDQDPDDDNDGVDDVDDDFPLNPNETTDTDGDGVGDNADEDDDNDGWSDAIESDCGSDQMDPDSVPADQDGDSQCDATDADIDGDGYNNDDDEFPSDAAEWVDSDGDGTGDKADSDYDVDGLVDADDEFPDDASEWVDSDGDGIGDNADSDDDGDGWGDSDDEFPDDASEWVDSDGDGTGDNADSDDDGDGWSDATESDCGSDSLDEDSVPADFDSDGQCDDLDPDDDGDGVADSDDAKPMDPSEWDDFDGDGQGDNADLDDDGDGYSDADETDCGSDPLNANSIPTDTDGDGICEVRDNDNTDGPDYVDPDEGGSTPGFGLISALAMLALAALARRD